MAETSTTPHEPGRTAYEARFAGFTLGPRGVAEKWEDLLPVHQAIWARVEEAVLANLSVSTPTDKGPFTHVYNFDAATKEEAFVNQAAEMNATVTPTTEPNNGDLRARLVEILEGLEVDRLWNEVAEDEVQRAADLILREIVPGRTDAKLAAEPPHPLDIPAEVAARMLESCRRIDAKCREIAGETEIADLDEAVALFRRTLPHWTAYKVEVKSWRRMTYYRIEISRLAVFGNEDVEFYFDSGDTPLEAMSRTLARVPEASRQPDALSAEGRAD